MSKPVEPNNIGLTALRTWDSSYTSSPPLIDQMTASGVAHTVHQLPQIVGMGGNAYLLCYTSPKTSTPVTVLVVPHRSDVDQFAEDYFYFEGMDESAAVAGDFEARWAELYDLARDMQDPT